MLLGESKTGLRPEISSPVRENREEGEEDEEDDEETRSTRRGKVVEVRKGEPPVCHPPKLCRRAACLTVC